MLTCAMGVSTGCFWCLTVGCSVLSAHGASTCSEHGFTADDVLSPRQELPWCKHCWQPAEVLLDDGSQGHAMHLPASFVSRNRCTARIHTTLAMVVARVCANVCVCVCVVIIQHVTRSQLLTVCQVSLPVHCVPIFL